MPKCFPHRRTSTFPSVMFHVKHVYSSRTPGQAWRVPGDGRYPRSRCPVCPRQTKIRRPGSLGCSDPQVCLGKRSGRQPLHLPTGDREPKSGLPASRGSPAECRLSANTVEHCFGSGMAYYWKLDFHDRQEGVFVTVRPTIHWWSTWRQNWT